MSDETAAPSLLAKTASGAGWVVGFRLVTRLLGIVSTLIVARILGPSDFGLVALASGFAQTVNAITNLSVHEAIIRERNPSRAMYDTAFTMSLIRGLITSVVLAVGAQPTAEFFHEPRLAAVLWALGISNLIGALENIATADFMKNFAFRQEFKLWTLPRVLQVTATITAALIWRSYWALVCGIIVGQLIRTVLSYIMRPYMPSLTLSAWRQIAGFTTWSWATYMVSILRDRIDTTLIGRLFSATQVGIYSLGGEIALLPTSELVGPLCRACFPSFSHLRNEGLSVSQTFCRLFGASAMIVLPAGLGIAAVADPLVKLAFGPGWVDAIPMIKILGVVGALTMISNLSGTLFSAFAMLRLTFGITLAMTVLRVAMLLVFLPGGTLLTAALVVAAVTAAEQAIYVVLTVRTFDISVMQLVYAVQRSLFAALAMLAALVWLGLGFTSVEDQFAIHLIFDSAVGAIIYAAVLSLTWWIAGKPDGAERDMLNVLGRTWKYSLNKAMAVIR